MNEFVAHMNKRFPSVVSLFDHIGWHGWKSFEDIARNNPLNLAPAIIREMLTKLGWVEQVERKTENGVEYFRMTDIFTSLWNETDPMEVRRKLDVLSKREKINHRKRMAKKHV